MPVLPRLAHSRHSEHLPRPCQGLQLGLEGALPCRRPLPSPQPLVAALFQFLQVWNVSVYHQCQPDSENLQLREACWGLPGGAGGKRWEQAPFTIHYVRDPIRGTWPLWALEWSNQVGVRSPQLPTWAPSPLSSPFYLSRICRMMDPPPRSHPCFWAFDHMGFSTCCDLSHLL